MATSYLDALKKMWTESDHLTNPPLVMTAIEAAERQKEAAKKARSIASSSAFASSYPIYSPYTSAKTVMGLDMSTIAHMKHFFESIGCDTTPEAIAALTKECVNGGHY